MVHSFNIQQPFIYNRIAQC